jgi:molecular chaperone GrpE
MGGEPDDPAMAEGGLSIDIDPELIAAAISAVNSRARKRKKPAFAPGRLQEETGDPVTVDIEGELARDARAAAGLSAEAASGSAERGGSPEPAPRPPATGAPPAAGPAALEVQLLNERLRDAQDRLRRAEAEVLAVSRDRDALDRQLRELREGLQRQTQDAEAARVRFRKEREEAERGVEERVLREIFDVGDNVERGIAHASQDPVRVAAGLQMIHGQFQGLLRRLGVERIESSPGTLFDPACHEALLHQPTDRVLPGCIVEEVTGGFSLRGRMLRPARVVVASTPTPEE